MAAGRPGRVRIDVDDEEIAERVCELIHAKDVAAQSLGVRLLAAGPGAAVTQLEVVENMANGHGICHGGVIFTLADCAFAYACNSRNESSIAASASIDFLKPARLGDSLTAVASERAVSGRSGFYEVLVSNQGGDRIALYHGRAYRLKGEKVIGVESGM